MKKVSPRNIIVTDSKGWVTRVIEWTTSDGLPRSILHICREPDKESGKMVFKVKFLLEGSYVRASGKELGPLLQGFNNLAKSAFIDLFYHSEKSVHKRHGFRKPMYSFRISRA